MRVILRYNRHRSAIQLGRNLRTATYAFQAAT